MDYSVGGHQTLYHSMWKAWDGSPVILGTQILACLQPAARKAGWVAALGRVLPTSRGTVCQLG